MKSKSKINIAEKVLRNATSTCCGSNEDVRVIYTCDSFDKECNVMAVCPHCQSRFSVDEDNLESVEAQKNDHWVCDNISHVCKAA